MADQADLTDEFREIDMRRSEAVAAYRRGQRLTEVAAAHGVPVSTVVDWVQQEPW